jgi:hypothetical protein
MPQNDPLCLGQNCPPRRRAALFRKREDRPPQTRKNDGICSPHGTVRCPPLARCIIILCHARSCYISRSKQLTQPSATAAVSTSKSSGSQKDGSAGKEGSGSNSPRSDGEELSSHSPNLRSVRKGRAVRLEDRPLAFERKNILNKFV